MNIKKHKSSN